MDRVLKTQARDVREQLRRILESDGFIASARNRHFLEYVVEETLAGRADRIKAYSVATAVFGRGPDFNPDLDSIVRIRGGAAAAGARPLLSDGGRQRRAQDCNSEGDLRARIWAGQFKPATHSNIAFSLNHPTFFPKSWVGDLRHAF